MPQYVYECTECKRELEINHSIKEDARERQMHIKRGGNGEACNGKLKRLIVGVSVHFRGSGWTPKHYS